MTVITVVNAPNSLRGDLTKWMQEIATGVYVGNFNSRVREQLWQRVTQSIVNGQATMSYTYRNEIGYQFETHNTHRRNVSYDGIPLVLTPVLETESIDSLHRGFSNVSKFRKAKKFASGKERAASQQKNYVVIDIETDGLDAKNNQIIEIGAVKVEGDQTSEFQQFIKYSGDLPEEIINLTGITEAILASHGIQLADALEGFMAFIGNLPIVGFALDFDIKFINQQLMRLDMLKLNNKNHDLLRYIKKDKMFLENYRLETVLKAYEINKIVAHRALSDAELVAELSMKVNGFLDLIDNGD